MQISRKEGALVPSSTTEIEPAYQNALAQTENHYRVMVVEVKYQKQKYKIFDLTNTICKIAQKRALVAGVLSSCGASEFFNQDLEEMSGGVR